MVQEDSKAQTPFLTNGQNTKQDMTNDKGNGAACCGIPLLPWKTSKPGQDERPGAKGSSSNQKSAAKDTDTSLQTSLYNLFTCNAPLNFCSCGTGLFCDTAYSNKKVLSGPKVPNSVYTEVVVTEPRPTGFCLGWYNRDQNSSPLHVSTQVSPIYKKGSTASLERVQRTDSQEVITQPPVSDLPSPLSTPSKTSRPASLNLNSSPATNSLTRRSKRTPVIPWNTEFKSRSVIIEDRKCDVTPEQEVMLTVKTQTTDDGHVCEISQDSGFNDSVSTHISDPVDTDLSYECKEYQLCFVDNDVEDSDSDTCSQSDDVEHKESDSEDAFSESVEIPLTPYSVKNHSWNGRLELLQDSSTA